MLQPVVSSLIDLMLCSAIFSAQIKSQRDHFVTRD
jgi:hypothetical protein